MADFFFDSSAVVKRYVNELGSGYVEELVESLEIRIMSFWLKLRGLKSRLPLPAEKEETPFLTMTPPSP